MNDGNNTKQLCLRFEVVAPCGMANQSTLQTHTQRTFDFENSPTEPTPPTLPPAAKESEPQRSSEPVLFFEVNETYERILGGEITASEFQAVFTRLFESKNAFTEDLTSKHNATKLKQLAAYFGSFDARRSTKSDNVLFVYRAALRIFTLGETISYQPFAGETLEGKAAEIARSVTNADLAAYARSVAEKKAADEKCLTNPETREEFYSFCQKKGESSLTDEQLLRYDTLRANESKKQRASEKRSSTVTQFESELDASFQITIKEGYHDRRKCPLWICQMSERVERATYRELLSKAKQLGGWYSSFKRDDAGFQFTSKESAGKFAALLACDVDRSEELATRKTRKEETAAERLLSLAETLEARAEETLAADAEKLKNTVRRAEMAAGIRGRACADQRTAKTLRLVAEKLEAGKAQYLDGIRHKTHVETLMALLRRARTNHNQHVEQEARAGHREPLSFSEREAMDQRLVTDEDIRFAEYPYPSFYVSNLAQCVRVVSGKNGCKNAARWAAKLLSGKDSSDFLTVKSETTIAKLLEFFVRARSVGYDTQYLERTLALYKRLQTANISSLPELRMALRELLPLVGAKRSDDPVEIAERELLGKNLPGFFPTPGPVIRQMLELAEIPPAAHVLEPSCGKGDILDSLRESHPDATVTALELNQALSDVLSAKGHRVEFSGFLEHGGEYDRIIMNPPFEKGQDAEHVQHAYRLLRPGGRLVSVMSEGPFFRSDKNSEQFREWFAGVAGESEQLPEDSFRGVEAFRETGVRTRLVAIDKPIAS